MAAWARELEDVFEGTEVGKRGGGVGDRIESSKTWVVGTATQLPKITKPEP